MLFLQSDMEITGELDAGEYDQPSGAHSRIYGCAQCKARIYAVNDAREGMASLRCGTLDNGAELAPAAHVWVKSKQPWIGLPADAVTMDEQPRTNKDWMKLEGIV
ncbi:MAG: hypothetical protein APF78_07525 [Sphingomonadales bacterium BRH_c3]|nr:MAG: hypothetical protein APF78_07525 [Sphingomonadales bacterium BRH_c3]